MKDNLAESENGTSKGVADFGFGFFVASSETPLFALLTDNLFSKRISESPGHQIQSHSTMMQQQNTRMGEKKVTVTNGETTVHIMAQRADLGARQREQILKQEIISHVKADQ